jgi:hypothetical protein
MLSTVQLHHQPGGWTNEIDDLTTDFMLAAKLPPGKPTTTQMTPQKPLCIRHVPAQSLRAVHVQTLHP